MNSVVPTKAPTTLPTSRPTMSTAQLNNASLDDLGKMSGDEKVTFLEDKIQEFVCALPRLFAYFAVLAIGLVLIRCSVGCLKKRLLSFKSPHLRRKMSTDEEASNSEDELINTSNGLDPTLVGFFMGALKIVLQLLLCVTIAGMLGIKTTSLIAVFGASTLAIGLAMQGLLTDLANGVMLILFHTFRVNDHVQVADCEGIVEELSVFRTILRGADQRKYVIPNGKIGIVTVLKEHHR